MLAQRQLDLTVCMEEVHKPHNLAAIVRTADAIGIHRVHAVWPKTWIHKRKGTARGSQNWVDVKLHPDIGSAVAELKASGMQILADEAWWQRMQLTRKGWAAQQEDQAWQEE